MDKKELLQLSEILRNKESSFQGAYFIPKAWDYMNYKQKEIKEILVNPYTFYRGKIDYIINHPQPMFQDYSDASYYSTMIRTSTTYDHDHSKNIDDINDDGFKETGTFVKMIAYLPTLKAIGINVIYLLPIMQYSRMGAKGELGSVYGVQDFFTIDESLYDPITEGEMDVNGQFKAFVQACHIYGMKVILDIIPRTNSINSKLLMSHPEWFYWIDMDHLDDYAPPFVDGISSTTKINDRNIQNVYQCITVKQHISKFCAPPNKQDSKKWEEVVSYYKEHPSASPLELIREHFHLTVAPAFSDSINDVQPAWSDVTFFRLYLDHPKTVRELTLCTSEHPYILFDTIKSDLYPGEQPNMELWELLSDILPFYINNFGIDGARTDMGHALPKELTQLIITKARDTKSDFYFIAEELSTKQEAALQAKELGYDLIIGDGYFHTHRFKEQKTRDFYYNGTSLPTTIFAAGETHDTPRLIARDGGFDTLRFVTILNQFAYNFAPFINSGQELLEKQPMNTGVDVDENSAYALDKEDPFYGKLALFDRYQFHYDNNYEDFMNTLIHINDIRQEYQQLIKDSDSTKYILTPNKDQIIFHYQKDDQNLYVIANANLSENLMFNLPLNDYKTLYSTSKSTSLALEPLAIRIILERKTT